MELELSFNKKTEQGERKSTTGTYIRIFLMTLIPVFIMVALQHLGFRAPEFNLLSPLPAKIDSFTQVSDKLKEKSNEYTLQKKVSVIPVSYASSDFDSLHAYSVIDFDSGEVLFDKNVSKQVSIASLTKIMTAVVVLDLAQPEESFSVSKRAEKMIPTKIGVVTGQTMTVKELLSAALITSANDAVQVLKEGIDRRYGNGTFVKAMNAKAEIIGLKNSHFTNPQGFDSKEHYSSVEDLAILTHYALSNYPLIAEIVKKDYAFLAENQDHKQFDLYNWNGLIDVYPNVNGVKIGNTDEAGKTTIVLSERNGKKLLVVVLGADTILHRDLYAAQLLDAGYEKTLGLSPINVTEEQLQEKYGTWKFFE